MTLLLTYALYYMFTITGFTCLGIVPILCISGKYLEAGVAFLCCRAAFEEARAAQYFIVLKEAKEVKND